MGYKLQDIPLDTYYRKVILTVWRLNARWYRRAARPLGTNTRGE